MVRSSTFFPTVLKLSRSKVCFLVSPLLRGVFLLVFSGFPLFLENQFQVRCVRVFHDTNQSLPFILLSVRFPHTVKYWARLHRAAMTNLRKGSFQKSELALARAFSRGTHRLPKYARRLLPDRSFCKWNRLFPRVLKEKRFNPCMLLGFDWYGWIAVIKSEILITTGMAWQVSSFKWQSSCGLVTRSKEDGGYLTMSSRLLPKLSFLFPEVEAFLRSSLSSSKVRCTAKIPRWFAWVWNLCQLSSLAANGWIQLNCGGNREVRSDISM